ncbi:MAG TPA: hypothetical protein VK918_03205 [Pyrinomonadaceae bacterium]|nr:hypothetical protein [Pyrinomonadaceae bacterium]
MENKRFILIMLAATVLLTIPLAAMAFTDEVKWGIFDFIVMGVLLFGTGLVIEAALRMIPSFKLRLIAVAGILAVLFLVWAELAVGIFGTPFAGS